MKLRHLPNLISILRIVLIVPYIVLLLDQRYMAALIVFAVAGASDALDGFLAKQYGWITRLGGYLDPLADKALLIAAFVTLGLLGEVPLWLVLVVIFRDLVILIGASYYHFRIEKLTAEPRWLSKLNTFSQIILVITVMVDLGVYALPDMYLSWSMIWVLMTTVISGLDYVVTWVWVRRATLKT